MRERWHGEEGMETVQYYKSTSSTVVLGHQSARLRFEDPGSECLGCVAQGIVWRGLVPVTSLFGA